MWYTMAANLLAIITPFPLTSCLALFFVNYIKGMLYVYTAEQIFSSFTTV